MSVRTTICVVSFAVDDLVSQCMCHIVHIPSILYAYSYAPTHTHANTHTHPHTHTCTLMQMQTGGADERAVENFLDEIAMMKKVSSGECCHVVQMVGCVSTALPLALVLEFVPFGDLLSYLRHCRQMVRPMGCICMRLLRIARSALVHRTYCY